MNNLRRSGEVTAKQLEINIGVTKGGQRERNGRKSVDLAPRSSLWPSCLDVGNFYTNFTIVGADSEEALGAVKALRRRAYVISSKLGATVIYDQECDEQNVHEIVTLGGQLAEEFGAPVIGVLNHDDDHLLIWVFRPGRDVVAYGSWIDAPGFAWTLSRAKGGVLAYPLIVGVLGWPIVVFQFLRHKALVALLSLPPCAVGFGYTYLSRGEIPPGCSVEDVKRN